MPHLRHLASLLLAAAALVLTACGGGGGGDSGAETGTPAPLPVQVDSARTARATIDVTGGTLSATAADGRRYTLTVPPGALAAATEITATPVLSMGSAPLAAGVKGAVRFGPAGLQFALPATLRIEGANTVAGPGTTLVGFVRSGDGASMQFVPPVVVVGALQMEVRHFSDAGVSQATAEQLAQIPIDAAAEPADALVDEATRALATASTEALQVAELIRLHDTRVAPRLTQAEFQALSTPAERTLAVLMARAWLSLIKVYFDSNLADGALPGELPSVVTALRQRVLDLLTQEFEAGRTACMAPAPIGIAQLEGLEAALRARQAVFGFRFVGGLPGLDADTAGRRLNDCVRVVFVPRALPKFDIGRPVSLDARAQLLFAADPNAVLLAAYAFSVTSSDATVANPVGFADIDGQYTTVVTPTAANPVFDVKACVVVALNNGPTELCGQQTVGGAPTAVVLAGRATRTFNFVNTATGASGSVQGTVDFRVRAEADGKFTVLEALGTVTEVGSGNAQCRPDGITLSQQRLSTREVHTITRGSHFGSGLSGGFGFRGPTTRTVETIVDPNTNCNVVTLVSTIDEAANFGNVLIVGIERDADGQPSVITLGGSAGIDGEITGSLRRQ